MGRQPQTVRKALTREFDEFANKISKYLSDRELSDTILAQGREFYISIFQPRDGRAHG
jgi:hypothetical protein